MSRHRGPRSSLEVQQHEATLEVYREVSTMLDTAQKRLGFAEETAAENDEMSEPFDDIGNAISGLEARMDAIKGWLAAHEND